MTTVHWGCCAGSLHVFLVNKVKKENTGVIPPKTSNKDLYSCFTGFCRDWKIQKSENDDVTGNADTHIEPRKTSTSWGVVLFLTHSSDVLLLVSTWEIYVSPRPKNVVFQNGSGWTLGKKKKKSRRGSASTVINETPDKGPRIVPSHGRRLGRTTLLWGGGPCKRSFTNN